MREPSGPLNTMKDLKEKGYYNNVTFVCTHKDVSLEACDLRAKVFDSTNHIIRKVPFNFHDLCIKTLPDSVDKIYEDGFNNKVIDKMNLVLRNGKTVWNNNDKTNTPGSIYQKYLNNLELSIVDKNNKYLAHKTTEIEKRGFDVEIKNLETMKKQLIDMSMAEAMLENYYKQETVAIQK